MNIKRVECGIRDGIKRLMKRSGKKDIFGVIKEGGRSIAEKE
jgi:hypothetical protein